jgi:hypothetical protein
MNAEITAARTGPAPDDAPLEAGIVGRERELDAIDTILRDGTPPLAVLTGPAGSGKSLFLRQVGHYASMRGWAVIPGPAGPAPLVVTPDTDVESFYRELQAMLGITVDDISIGRNATTPPAPAVLDQLRQRAPLLILVDDYHPTPSFGAWFTDVFIPSLRGAAEAVIVAVACRPDVADRLALADTRKIELVRLGADDIRRLLADVGQHIAPPMSPDELDAYVAATLEDFEALGRLTRVLLRLAGAPSPSPA